MSGHPEREARLPSCPLGPPHPSHLYFPPTLPASHYPPGSARLERASEDPAPSGAWSGQQKPGSGLSGPPAPWRSPLFPDVLTMSEPQAWEPLLPQPSSALLVPLTSAFSSLPTPGLHLVMKGFLLSARCPGPASVPVVPWL